jgi:hypothetical protein
MIAWIRQHPRLVRALLTTVGLFSLFGLGLGVRRVVLDAQYVKLGVDFPFTLESALHYRRVKMLHDTGSVPDHDPMVGAPEGVQVRSTYEFGSERIQSTLARMLPSSLSVGDRLRWIEAGWFCLGIPLLALWLWGWLGDWRAGLVGGALYAVSIAAVMRSTGHELSKENFALPLLLGHLALAARVAGRRGWSLHAWSAASAFVLGWSLWNWDLIQFYAGLWALYTAWQSLRRDWTRAPDVLVPWMWNAAALVVVGAASPYYRYHGFLLSLPLLLVYAVALRELAGRCLPARWQGRIRPWQVAALGLLLGVGLSQLTRYGAAYAHFGELVWAKLRFANVKPADPSLLTFEQRIMWVPALHSATWKLTLQLFPASLWLALMSAVAAVRVARRQTFPACPQLLFYFLASLVAFIFFVRFQVFLALFACALVGWWFARARRQGGLGFVLVAVLVGLGWMAEFARSVREPDRWGRGNVYYAEMVELTRWLREHVAPDTVLANFGISGAIATYGKCAVVLHPKFEDPVIRDRVRTFGEHMFKGTELSLRDWAGEVGADYLVYGKGEFSERVPELQMRYFVDALKPDTNSPAWRFEFRPTGTKWFRHQWGNHKYSVYKILTQADEQAAIRHGRRAWAAWTARKLDEAESAAVEALQLNPDEPVAQEVLRQLGAQRRQAEAPARSRARP